MFREYFNHLWGMWSRPTAFFSEHFLPEGAGSARFAALTGVLLAMELGLWEAVTGGFHFMVLFVTSILLLAMPLAVLAGAFLWTRFMRLCAYLVGEELPADLVQPVVAYSTAGLAAFALGPGLGKWLALSMLFFQFLGVEKAMACSRWTAVVLVGLPFSLVAVLLGFFTLIFKIYR